MRLLFASSIAIATVRRSSSRLLTLCARSVRCFLDCCAVSLLCGEHCCRFLFAESDGSSAIIGHSAFRVAFMRTLRVPDNGQVNELPPGLPFALPRSMFRLFEFFFLALFFLQGIGQFPLFNVRDSLARGQLPPQWAAAGGVFLPMYQREAMWMSFSARQPVAVKVLVGNTNAISGLFLHAQQLLLEGVLLTCCWAALRRWQASRRTT